MAKGHPDTMQEALPQLMHMVADMKMMAETDLPWLVMLENIIMQRMQQPVRQMQQAGQLPQTPGQPSQPGQPGMGMGGPPPMQPGMPTGMPGGDQGGPPQQPGGAVMSGGLSVAPRQIRNMDELHRLLAAGA